MSTLHDPDLRGFASDNYSGVHEEVLAAIAAANGAHQIAYGEDVYTERLQEAFRREFGEQAQAFPVFNGTGANVTGLQSMLPAGAPWCRPAPRTSTPTREAPREGRRDQDPHRRHPSTASSPPRSSTNRRGGSATSTAPSRSSSRSRSRPRTGTVYTPQEVRALADHAHSRGMRLHMDGARIANAAAALGGSLRSFTTDAGVDVLSFGGTKNGMLLGEAIVVLDPDASSGLTFLRKTNMQLSSKMRFISAQLLAMLGDGSGEALWLRSARHANSMAARLRSHLDEAVAAGRIRGLAFTQPTHANAVFATLPAGVADRLREGYRFYDWNPATGEVRWVCSFDTTEADIDAFTAAIERELAA